MSGEPASVRIRTYNVGFGDCFLLTFAYDGGDERHVLIDFGTMGLPRASGSDTALHSTADVADHIAATCGSGGLTAVVATHRHQDHISGFSGASGATIAGLEPKLVMQPWTEQPDLATDATEPAGRTVRRLGLVDSGLAGELASRGLLFTSEEGEDFEVERLADGIDAYRREKWSADDDEVDEIVFVGNNNVSNRDAIERLSHTMGDAHEYLHAGQPTSLEKVLPGVTVRVLGPPTVAQDGNVARQRDTHATEFWHLIDDAWAGFAAEDEPAATPERLDPVPVAGRGFPASPDEPVETRWLRRRLQSIDSRDLLSIVRDLDDALNNTSLILMFELWDGDRCRRLLFPGDAQLENWQHCIESDGDLLAATDVYKVGHHGSLNATPRESLWGKFAKKSPDGADDRLVTLLSTKDGRHGHAEDGTEVPRTTLVEALRAESTLVDTREMSDGAQPMFGDIVVTPDGVTVG